MKIITVAMFMAQEKEMEWKRKERKKGRKKEENFLSLLITLMNIEDSFPNNVPALMIDYKKQQKPTNKQKQWGERKLLS